MFTKRIIPCLDVNNGRVVKGVNFAGLRDVSSPVELARHYSGCGADELVFYDITASAEGRKLFTDVLREGTELIFIGDEDIISQAFNVEVKGNSCFLPHILSRKKQIVPMLSVLWG